MNGDATMDTVGGVCLPNSQVPVNGNSAMGSSCFANLDYSLSGNSDTTFDGLGCPGYAPYPLVQTVRLVE